MSIHPLCSFERELFFMNSYCKAWNYNAILNTVNYSLLSHLPTLLAKRRYRTLTQDFIRPTPQLPLKRTGVSAHTPVIGGNQRDFPFKPESCNFRLSCKPPGNKSRVEAEINQKERLRRMGKTAGSRSLKRTVNELCGWSENSYIKSQLDC